MKFLLLIGGEVLPSRRVVLLISFLVLTGTRVNEVLADVPPYPHALPDWHEELSQKIKDASCTKPIMSGTIREHFERLSQRFGVEVTFSEEVESEAYDQFKQIFCIENGLFESLRRLRYTWGWIFHLRDGKIEFTSQHERCELCERWAVQLEIEKIMKDTDSLNQRPWKSKPDKKRIYKESLEVTLFSSLTPADEKILSSVPVSLDGSGKIFSLDEVLKTIRRGSPRVVEGRFIQPPRKDVSRELDLKWKGEKYDGNLLDFLENLAKTLNLKLMKTQVPGSAAKMLAVYLCDRSAQERARIRARKRASDHVQRVLREHEELSEVWEKRLMGNFKRMTPRDMVPSLEEELGVRVFIDEKAWGISEKLKLSTRGRSLRRLESTLDRMGVHLAVQKIRLDPTESFKMTLFMIGK